MIVDRLDRCREVLDGPVWAAAFAYLATLGPDAPAGNFAIQGEDLEARVMSYETIPESEGRIEAHREHIDIQMSLAGEEEIGWWPIEGLEPSTEYDAADDVTFFRHPGTPHTKVTNRPGHCTILFPEDAHMPKVAIGAPLVVRKVVVKIRVSALK